VNLQIDDKGLLSGPNVTVKLLPEAWEQPEIVPWMLIFHTNGGGNSATGDKLWAYLSNGSVTSEPHLQVDDDGHIWQMMPFTRRADSNTSANRFPVTVDGRQVYAGAISVETQDPGYLAGQIDAVPWTGAQVQSLTAIGRILVDTYGIPTQPVTAWNGRGIAPHNAFSVWSSSSHTCPGKARTAQVPGIIAALTESVSLPPHPPEEDDMSKVTELVSCKGAVFEVVDDGIEKNWIAQGGSFLDNIAYKLRDRIPGIYDPSKPSGSQATIREVPTAEEMCSLGPVRNCIFPSAAHGGQTLIQLGWDQYGWKV
jgi:hypothetical protein